MRRALSAQLDMETPRSLAWRGILDVYAVLVFAHNTVHQGLGRDLGAVGAEQLLVAVRLPLGRARSLPSRLRLGLAAGTPVAVIPTALQPVSPEVCDSASPHAGLHVWRPAETTTAATNVARTLRTPLLQRVMIPPQTDGLLVERRTDAGRREPVRPPAGLKKPSCRNGVSVRGFARPRASAMGTGPAPLREERIGRWSPIPSDQGGLQVRRGGSGSFVTRSPTNRRRIAAS